VESTGSVKGGDFIKEGTHLSKKYGFTRLPYKGVYYINMDSKAKNKAYRAIWKKAFTGTGKFEFDPITDDNAKGTGGLSCSIAFEVNRLCPDCDDIVGA